MRMEDLAGKIVVGEFVHREFTPFSQAVRRLVEVGSKN